MMKNLCEPPMWFELDDGTKIPFQIDYKTKELYVGGKPVAYKHDLKLTKHQQRLGWIIGISTAVIAFFDVLTFVLR